MYVFSSRAKWRKPRFFRQSFWFFAAYASDTDKYSSALSQLREIVATHNIASD